MLRPEAADRPVIPECLNCDSQVNQYGGVRGGRQPAAQIVLDHGHHLGGVGQVPGG